MEHYTRDADGLCVNLRKPCVQVILNSLHFIFPIFATNVQMKFQIGSISTGASTPPTYFGSSSGPAGSINLPLSYFYQHIHQNLPNSSVLSAQTNNQFSFNSTNQPVQFFTSSNRPFFFSTELMICHQAAAVERKMRISTNQQ